MVREVKKEGIGKRPSALSKWYRRTLGPKFAITDIDWLITNIKNKDPRTRYLIIEEKNVSSFDSLLIGLGPFRSLKELATDIIKENIPIFVVFIKNEDISEGVYVYKLDPQDVDDKSLWVQIGTSWYSDVRSKSKFLSENELAQLIRDTTVQR